MMALQQGNDWEARWVTEHRRFAEVLYNAGVVAEPTATFGTTRRPDERLVQAIWFDQLFRAEGISTASGKALEVLEPGRWNTAAGPDFLDARVRVAGEELHGSIEIHVDSEDWYRHGHDHDFEYNPVVLHVVLRGSDDRPYDEKQNGRRLERFILGDALETDLDTLRQSINPADYPFAEADGELGLCHSELLKLPEQQLEDFFLSAGRARIEAKVRRFTEQARNASPNQLFYQALLTSLGMRSSKTLYFLLSRRAPIEELQMFAKDFPESERAEAILSVLLNVAQLLPPAQEFLEADEETKTFRERLDKYWRHLRPYFADRLIPPTKRWFSGVRPAGFPTRRLTAAAVLIERGMQRAAAPLATVRARVEAVTPTQLETKAAVAFRKSLLESFIVDEPQHYFSTHFTLGGKKQAAPQALLGEPAAESLLFNVVLPLLIVEARKEKDRNLERRTWEVISAWPSLEKNSVVRFMARRLFAQSGREKGLLRREIYQQSLLKVFSDCCSLNEKSCLDCTLLALRDQIATERVTSA